MDLVLGTEGHMLCPGPEKEGGAPSDDCWPQDCQFLRQQLNLVGKLWWDDINKGCLTVNHAFSCRLDISGFVELFRMAHAKESESTSPDLLLSLFRQCPAHAPIEI